MNKEFGPCWDAPGIRGFYGERYWYHDIPVLRRWLRLKGSTFVAKTVTLEARIPPNGGNMPIKSLCPWQPSEWLPRAIWLDPFRRASVNAVGLSGPGAAAFLHAYEFGGERFADKPHVLSFMATAKTTDERLQEFKAFRRLVEKHLWMSVDIALQINFSCPNAGHDPAELIGEVTGVLGKASPIVEMGIPIIPKLNVLAPIAAVKEIAAHPNCSAICVSNTIPFGARVPYIGWDYLFPEGSPMRRRNPKWGDGGYSGPELLRLVGDFIAQAHAEGVSIPWNAGGGIRNAADVEELVLRAGLKRGRDSIFFATAAMVCPWNVPGIIRKAHELLG